MEGMLVKYAIEMKDLVQPVEGTVLWHTPHWCEGKAIQVTFTGRRPASMREWARCIYNFDIFFGPVPILKPLIVLIIAGIIH